MDRSPAPLVLSFLAVSSIQAQSLTHTVFETIIAEIPEGSTPLVYSRGSDFEKGKDPAVKTRELEQLLAETLLQYTSYDVVRSPEDFRIDRAPVIVFTSANGTSSFFHYNPKNGRIDLRAENVTVALLLQAHRNRAIRELFEKEPELAQTTEESFEEEKPRKERDPDFVPVKDRKFHGRHGR